MSKSKHQRGPDGRHRAHHPNQKSNQTQIQPSARTPIEIPKPPGHDDQKENNPNARNDKIEFAFKLVAAIAAAVGIPVLSVQSCANLKQAKAAQDQLAETARENALSERAWIYIEVGDNSVYPNETGLFITATATNAGKTPALITASAQFSALNTNSIFRATNDARAMSLVINPNTSATLLFPISDLGVAALALDKPIYFFGTVFYQDIYGKKHWSECCYSIHGHGQITERMPFHNSCDALESQTNH